MTAARHSGMAGARLQATERVHGRRTLAVEIAIDPVVRFIARMLRRVGRDDAAGAKLPGSRKRPPQKRRLAVCCSVRTMKKTVDPTMIIISPVSARPALTASAAASAVPVMTGVPTASPVTAAAAA